MGYLCLAFAGKGAPAYCRNRCLGKGRCAAWWSLALLACSPRWSLHRHLYSSAPFLFKGYRKDLCPLISSLRRYLSGTCVSSSSCSWPLELRVWSVLIPDVTLWLGQRHRSGGRECVWRQRARIYTPKPQNMPKNNKSINHWPKRWWNSISTSPFTSKHENAIPEGMEETSNERSRENKRRRKAGLGKKSNNFYTLQSLQKFSRSDN